MILREEYDFSEPAEYSYNDKAFDNSQTEYAVLDQLLKEYATWLYPNSSMSDETLLEGRRICENNLINILPNIPDVEDFLSARQFEYENQARNIDAIEQRLGVDTIFADILATKNCLRFSKNFQQDKRF